MKRLFFSLRFSDAQQRALLLYQQLALNVCSEAVAVAAENFHLTLFFLGQTSAQQEQQLLSAAKLVKLTPCSVTFDYLAYFSKPKIAYLAPSVIPQPLLNLQQDLTAVCLEAGFQQQHPVYKPHITLLRNVKPLALFPEAVPPLTLQITDFSLYHSTRRDDKLVYLPLTEETTS